MQTSIHLNTIRWFTSTLVVLFLMLTITEIYVSYGLYESEALKVVNNSQLDYLLIDKDDDPVSNPLGQAECFQFTWKIEDKDQLSDQVYLVFQRNSYQEAEIWLNGEELVLERSGLLASLELQRLVVVPITKNQLLETNTVLIELYGGRALGIRNHFAFLDEDVFLRILHLVRFDQLMVYCIYFCTLIFAIAFILFSFLLVGTGENRAPVYRLTAYALIAFALNDMNILPFAELDRYAFYPFISTFFFLVSVICLGYSFYLRHKESYAVIIVYLQVGILIFTPILLFAGTDASWLTQVFRLTTLVLSCIIALRFWHEEKEGYNKVPIGLFANRWRLLLVVIFFSIGQILRSVQLVTYILPNSILHIIATVIPMLLSLNFFETSLFREMEDIQLENAKEKQKLEMVNENIYEYVHEGVFAIPKDLMVKDTYTKICSRIFEQSISGAKAYDLLSDEETSPELIKRLLDNLFGGRMPWIVCIELLPSKLTKKGHYYKVAYEMVDGEDGMDELIVRLTDETDRIQLQKQMEDERNKLAMSVTSLLNREELIPLINEFIEYMANIKEIEEDEDERHEILNMIHTFKGNFSIFNFIHVTEGLHELESSILSGHITDQGDYDFALERLYKDLEIITEITGSSFFEDTLYLQANIKNLESVYEEVKKYFYNTEASLIIYIIKKIFNKSIRDILLFYGREARKKAMEQGKEIKTIDVVGDEIFLDYSYYKNAMRSLVHIFNNCIDHGIEEEEERLLVGKPKAAEIQCRINDFGNFFEIIIKDDGRGVDVQKVGQRMIERGIVTEEELGELSEDEIVNHVFDPRLSTLSEVSKTSGRGVGLASTKKEVERVGGEIRLESFMDFGTEIKILLPKESETLISYFSPSLLMDLFVEAFKIYIKSNNIFELPLNIAGRDTAEKLHPYNAKIAFEGPENGYFFMSCNKATMIKLAQYLSDEEEISDEELEEMSVEVINETCNIVAGNSTSVFDLEQKYIDLLSPEDLEGQIINLDQIMYKWHMHYMDFDIILGIIMK